VILGWNGSGNDITGTLKPSPISTATITGNTGIWPGPATSVFTPRAFQTIAANSLSTQHSALGTVPDLIDWAQSLGFSGAPTHAALVQWLRDNPDKVNAGNCIAWASAAIAKLMAPATTATPASVPAIPPVPLFTAPATIGGLKVNVTITPSGN
jgi:hypothetical protein